MLNSMYRQTRHDGNTFGQIRSAGSTTTISVSTGEAAAARTPEPADTPAADTSCIFLAFHRAGASSATLGASAARSFSMSRTDSPIRITRMSSDPTQIPYFSTGKATQHGTASPGCWLRGALPDTNRPRSRYGLTMIDSCFVCSPRPTTRRASMISGTRSALVASTTLPSPFSLTRGKFSLRADATL